MAAKTVLIICAQALLIQVISGQCIRNMVPTGFSGCGNGIGLTDGYSGLSLSGIAANSNGGGLSVSSASPIVPSGLSVLSEYIIEGPVSVAGQLPFLSAVGVEGQVPTGGQGGVAYACGNGNVGLISEGLGNGAGLATGLAGGLAGPAMGGFATPGIAAGFGNIATYGNGIGFGVPTPGCRF